MPLYEYHCKKCNNTFESIESSDTDKLICVCGETATKIMSSSHFKITGFSEANGYSNCSDKKSGG